MTRPTPSAADIANKDVAAIAAGLSASQRKCILALSRVPAFATRATFNGRTAFTMCGTLTAGRWNEFFRRDTWHLTELGLAVRSHLERQS